MAKHPAGTVVVLRGRRRYAGPPRPHKPDERRLCRVYVEFTCWNCRRYFDSSVVAIYDPRGHPNTNGVGERVTPTDQLPKWCSTKCKRDARRKPSLVVPCARPGCDKFIRVRGNSNKKYHSHRCKELAYKQKREAERPPIEPSFAYALDPDALDAVAAMLRDAQDNRAMEAADEHQALREVEDAQDALSAATAHLEALLALPPVASPAPARLARLRDELESILAAPPEEQERQAGRRLAVESQIVVAENDVANARAWEGGQRIDRYEKLCIAREEEAKARTRLMEAERARDAARAASVAV